MPINTVYTVNTTGNRSAFVGLSEIVILWLSVVDVAKAITAITNILPKCVKKAWKNDITTPIQPNMKAGLPFSGFLEQRSPKKPEVIKYIFIAIISINTAHTGF